MRIHDESTKYASPQDANRVETLPLVTSVLGQGKPRHCPQPWCEHERLIAADPLGKPMTIRETAELVGCSVWTVRQQLLPAGLPCLRLGRSGKLFFYRNQVVRWILERQQVLQDTKKGGGIR